MDSVIALRSGHRTIHLLGKSITRLLAAALALGASVAPAMAGRTPGTAPGQFSVSPTGAATYQISIPVPPGVNGLKPSLALLYNSQAGNGLLGQGWSLSGLSVISHCPKTIDQDGVEALPGDLSTDRLCLDGERLIVTSGTYGALNSTYRTEIDSFRQVTISQVAYGSPSVFTVVDRSGLTSIYGGPGASVAGASGGYAAAPLLWLVKSITDKYGNFIDFGYNITNYTGAFTYSWDSINQITYGNAAGAVVGQVQFGYSTRSDSYNQVIARTPVTVNPTELTNITVKDGGGGTLETFTLGYNNANPQQQLATPPTELTSVKECGSDGSCYQPTTFNYDGYAAGFASGGGNELNSVSPMPGFEAVDFDGDGLPDYVFVNGGALYVVFGSNNAVQVNTSVPFTTADQAGIAFQNTVVMDLNGDGKQELLIPYYPHPKISPDPPVWYMLEWNGQTGVNANIILQPVPTTNGLPLPVCAESACSPIIAVGLDIKRSGQAGLFYEDGGSFYYYSNVSGALNPAPISVGLTYTGTPLLAPFDWQGDAAIYVPGQGSLYPSVIIWDPTAANGQGAFQQVNAGDGSYAQKIFFLDANGDGLTQAVVINGSNVFLVPNTGMGFNTSNLNNYQQCFSAPANADLNNFEVIDWYNDGRQELIVPVGNVWYLFQPSQCAFMPTTAPVPTYDPGSQMQVFDVNGDGQPDLIYTYNNHTSYLSNYSRPFLINQITDGLGHNTNIGYVPLGAETRGAYVNNQNFTPTPVNPPQTRLYNGAMTLVKDFAVDSGLFDSSNKPKQVYTYYLYGGAEIEQWGRGFLGFSEVEAINYNTGVYTIDTYRQDFPYTGMVATSTQSWDPNATLQSGYVGTQGVGVSCTSTNPAEPSCEMAHSPASTVAVRFITAGKIISTTTNCYANAYEVTNHCNSNNVGYNNAPAGVYSPYQASAESQQYDINPGDPNNPYVTTTTASYDQVVSASTPIGIDVMPTDVTVTTQDDTQGNSGDVSVVDTQSTYGDEATCPSRPTSVTVTDSLGSASYPPRTETLGYNGQCFLTSDQKTIVGPPGSSLSMTQTKSYGPDTYGNPLTVTVSATGVTARTTSMIYDASQRFPLTITNPLHQTETFTYDSWGNKRTDTDANGDAVTYLYDGFERKIEQAGPLPGVYVDFAYVPCNADTPTCAYDVVESTSADTAPAVSAVTPSMWPLHVGSKQTPNMADSSTEYDALGRVIETQKTGFGGAVITQQTQYDFLGRAFATSSPYKTVAALCWDVKGYDILNRVTTESQPLNSGQCNGTTVPVSGERVITTSYPGLTTNKKVAAPTTAASPASESSITILNVLGKPASIQDQGDPSGAYVKTSYNYDPWGNLISVTPPDGVSSQVSMSYDSAGDKLSMRDPDMGSWTYTYDGLGELKTQTDAKGQMVTNQYDLLGRLFDRVEAEGETRWVYDIAYGAGIGKLAYTVGPNGVWEGYAYDGFGETTDKITVVGGQEYWVTNTYDDQGRVSQVVYPNMTAVNVSSTPTTPAGLTVAQVLNPDNSTSFNLAWTLNSATQNGQIFHLYRTPSSITTPGSAYEIYSGPVPNWQDNTVTKDDTYTWWLQACNDTTCSGYISQSLVVVLPPTVPTFNLPATVQSTMSWQVSWSTSNTGQTGNTGTISYLAQVSYNGGAWTPLSATGTSATQTNSGDGSYAYRVQACASGACSNFSATATETIAIQPSVPQNITVPGSVTPQTSPANIPINWVAPAVNGGTANLYYTVTTFDGSKQIGVGPHQSQTNITDNESLDGVYSYLITVCDSISQLCNSANSAQVPVTLPPTNPGVPTYYSDYNAPTWPITWADSSTPGNPSGGTVSYTLQQSWNGGAFGDVIGAVTPPPQGSNIYSQVAKATLQSGYYQNGTYTYQLRACTSDPAVGGATACTAWIPSSGSGYVTTIAPDVPRNINVPAQSNGDGSFTVTFNAPALNAGGVVTGYNVKVYDTACVDGGACHDVLEALCQAAATATSCTFGPNSVPANSGYSLEMAAVDDTVKSVWVQLNLPNIWYLQAPAAPTLTSPNYTGTLSMSWTNVSGANSYNLYQSTDGTNYSLLKSVATGSGSTSTSVSGLRDGTYYYDVSACQTSTICSVQGPAASVSVLLPPTAPTGLGISPGTSYNGSFTLSWTAPAAATQYRVYRSTNGGSYAWVDTFNDSNSGTVSRVESGLADGSYSYFVYAWNSAGQGPASNTVSGTVLLPPPTPSISETDASDGIHYTINWSAATATSYTLYFESSTKTGSFPPSWTTILSNSPATSYYTKNSSAIYYIRYYVVATNAAGSTQSAMLQFVNPNAALSGGCGTCSKTNAPGPTTTSAPVSATGTSGSSAQPAAPATGPTAMMMSPSVGAPLVSAAASPALNPTSLDAIVASHQRTNRLVTVSAQSLEAFAPWAPLPALGPLPIDAMSIQSTRIIERLSLPRQVTRRHTRARPAVLFASVLPVSPRQAYFLTHAGRTTAPKPGHMRRARPAKQEQVVATARYAPPIDPILSLYPPLRGDIRVLAHFVARGGAAPARVRKADVDCRDTDGDVECTTADSPNALMVGYFYSPYGYLQKVEKLNASGAAIAELWQATDETAFGQVYQQVFDAPEGSTTGAFSITDNYDTGTGILSGTSASAADTTGGPSSLSASYTWDGYNNLLARGLSETVPTGQTGASPLSESFSYDTVNRMTGVTDSASNATTMQYNAVGGFQSNGVYTNYQYSNPGYTVGSYTYNQPHAVSSLSANGVTRSFTYDANGNLTSESGDVSRTLAWTSYNKPTSIVSGTTTETFVYGPSRERLQNSVVTATNTVTTTYIDGLFEQLTDSASGNTTYKHYIVAGGARVGVETIVVNSGGTATSDTLSFFVHDEVGSVIADVTENLGGSGQQLTIYGHDPWGKARPTSGAGANIALLPGISQPTSAVMAGQHEGFAGHEDLEDIGIVDMEGRVYDPETGRFLSPDPNVQYPDSSQGYNRYTYVNNNPLSLSDPTGYFSFRIAALAGDPVAGYNPQEYGRMVGTVGPIVGAFLNTIPFCQGWCDAVVTSASQAEAGYLESGSIGEGIKQGVITGVEAEVFTTIGGDFGNNLGSTALFERSLAEGLVGGAFASAGGGDFGDGFLGAFVSSEAGPLLDHMSKGPGQMIVAALIGGTASRLNGGNFATGALQAALQNLFNEQGDHSSWKDQDRPDLQEIANDPWVAANIDYAWDASNSYAPTDDGRLENAFWVYRNSHTGKYLVVNVSEATVTHDGVNNIGPAPAIEGATVVAFFHTHPNPYQDGDVTYTQGASSIDMKFSAARNIPLIIRARSGLYFYGPPVPH